MDVCDTVHPAALEYPDGRTVACHAVERQEEKAEVAG
jgi:hypothetical protein